MSKDLLPIDIEQCQSLKPNGAGPFTLGGTPGLIRCKEKPKWIAIEVHPTNESRGAMSLCDKCKKVCEIQMGVAVCFQKIGKDPTK